LSQRQHRLLEPPRAIERIWQQRLMHPTIRSVALVSLILSQDARESSDRATDQSLGATLVVQDHDRDNPHSSPTMHQQSVFARSACDVWMGPRDPLSS
jgi:hypothetical protein